MNLDEAMRNKKLILDVIYIINEYCPNYDKGGLCKKYHGCLECWEQELNTNKENKYTFQQCTDKWVTINGEVLELKDMSTEHLINSIHMIERICAHEKWNCKDFVIYRNLLKELKNRERFI